MIFINKIPPLDTTGYPVHHNKRKEQDFKVRTVNNNEKNFQDVLQNAIARLREDE